MGETAALSGTAVMLAVSSHVCGKPIGKFVIMNSDCNEKGAKSVTNIEIRRHDPETKKYKTIFRYPLPDGVSFDRKRVGNNDMRVTIEPDESVGHYFEEKGVVGLLMMTVWDVKKDEYGYLTIRGNYKGEFKAQVIRFSELPPNFAY
jgi:hypothetical protein